MFHGPAPAGELFGFAGAALAPVEIPAGLRGIADVRAVAALRRLIRDADIVHAHGLRAGLVAAATLARRPVPLVVSWLNRVPPGGRRALLVALIEGLAACGGSHPRRLRRTRCARHPPRCEIGGGRNRWRWCRLRRRAWHRPAAIARWCAVRSASATACWC
ncbi:MAG: glycosyltransferase [Mycobacteriales bacterium]